MMGCPSSSMKAPSQADILVVADIHLLLGTQNGPPTFLRGRGVWCCFRHLSEWWGAVERHPLRGGPSTRCRPQRVKVGYEDNSNSNGSRWTFVQRWPDAGSGSRKQPRSQVSGVPGSGPERVDERSMVYQMPCSNNRSTFILLRVSLGAWGGARWRICLPLLPYLGWSSPVESM